MIYNAFKHTPDIMEYCGKLQNQSIFNFCAIPQVMAISTLAILYNNTDALTRTIKIRKGITCDVALNCTSLPIVKGFFMRFIVQIQKHLIHPREDPLYKDATDEEMTLAIQLYEDMVDIMEKSIEACAGYEQINEGWDKVIAGFVAVGACLYGASSLLCSSTPTQ